MKDTVKYIKLKIDETKSHGLEKIHEPKLVTHESKPITVVSDGRRVDNGYIGFQSPYISLLPDDSSSIHLIWKGKEHDTELSKKHIRKSLTILDKKEGVDVILLTGGEHLHPYTTESTSTVNDDELNKYGGYCLARDIAGVELLEFAEKHNKTVISICRGMQLTINYFSNKTIKPRDHNQYIHTVIPGETDPILQLHKVKSILPKELKDRFPIIPEISIVNSAHAQGILLSDLTENSLSILRNNGWMPWLVADIEGIDEQNQVVEGWIRTNNDKITGVALQFHPERDYSPEENKKVREFIKRVIVS